MLLVACILGDIWTYFTILLFSYWGEVKPDHLNTLFSCSLRWTLKWHNVSQNEVPHVWIFNRITTSSAAVNCRFHHVA